MSTDASTESQILRANDVLLGAHRVEEELANGRIGAAYVVLHEGGARRAANVLHREHVADLGEWFLAAATLREGIDHPHMPRTFATGALPDGRPVEITELLEGESLREAVANRSVPLPIAVVARIVREVARALDDLHRRAPPIVHRALTPDNVLLTAPDGLVKLLGVGEADRPRIDDVRAGYQSPEALADIGSLTPRSDVFVLASLAYEALTGRPAFSGTADEVLGSLHSGARPSAAALRDEIPASADAVLQRCWALSPERRPATAGEAARDLSAALGSIETGEIAIVDEPTGAVDAPLRVVRRRNALLGPTLETPRPEGVANPRSFLENIERTEVSTPAVPAKPTPVAAAARPEAPAARVPSERPPPRGAALPRAGATPRVLARPPVGPPTPTPPTPAEPPAEPTDKVDAPTPGADARKPREEPTDPGIDAPPSPRAHARMLHDTLDTTRVIETPTPVAPPEPPAAPSPFADDPRATLQTTGEALGIAPPEAPAAPAPLGAPAAPAFAPPPHEPGASTLRGMQAPAPAPVAPARDEGLDASPATLPLAMLHHEPAPPAAAPFVPGPPVAPPVAQYARAQPLAQPPQQAAPDPRVTRPAGTASPHATRAPDAVVFPDEPTGAFNFEAPKRPSPWRSPWVIASIFLANAIVIVGIAHAIALAAAREPVVRVVQSPAAVCAPCAACAACPACAPSPTAQRVVEAAATRPAAPAAVARRPQGLIREVPAFGPRPVRR